jgi:hypothetical protein
MPRVDSAVTRPSAYWRGLLTIVALGGLTWFEFRISGGPILALLLVGLTKAVLILHFFMHITRLWEQE